MLSVAETAIAKAIFDTREAVLSVGKVFDFTDSQRDATEYGLKVLLGCAHRIATELKMSNYQPFMDSCGFLQPDSQP